MSNAHCKLSGMFSRSCLPLPWDIKHPGNKEKATCGRTTEHPDLGVTTVTPTENDRIAELPGVEKTFKLIELNHEPTTNKSLTKPKCCIYTTVIPAGMRTAQPLWASCSNAWWHFQHINSSKYPTQTSLGRTWGHFLLLCHYLCDICGFYHMLAHLQPQAI